MLIKRIIIDLDYPFIDYDWNDFLNYIQSISNFHEKDIKDSVFNEYYYYYLIGKYDFKKYIEYVCVLLNIKDKFEKIDESLYSFYKNSIIINKEKIVNFIKYCKNKKINFSFAINIGEVHYKKLISLVPDFERIDLLIPSFKMNTTTSDYLFFHNLKNICNIRENPEEILFIDNNVDNLITAKELGFITLFFDPDIDICNIISNHVLNF